MITYDERAKYDMEVRKVYPNALARTDEENKDFVYWENDQSTVARLFKKNGKLKFRLHGSGRF